MPQRVLEVGAGHWPAIVNPGTIFTEDNAEYVAIDAQRVREPEEYIPFDNAYVSLLSIKKVITDASAIPFEANQFDHVIFRSVFGAYAPSENDMQEDKPYQLQAGSWQGSTWNETLASIAESHRVLKPGGTICIAEEDTPIRSEYLYRELAKVGFCEISVVPSDMPREPTSDEIMKGAEIKGNYDWLVARGVYWSNRPRNRVNWFRDPCTGKYLFERTDVLWDAPAFNGNFNWHEEPYLVIAIKPEAA